MRFITPRYMFESYPQEFRDIYGREGLLVRDPIVHWGMRHTGVTRWSDLRDWGGCVVARRAKRFGIRFGHAHSIHEGPLVSIGSCARQDREFRQSEMDEAGELVRDMHEATHERVTLGTEASLKLREMSVVVTEPCRE